jgi:predicted RNA-binding Zn ribbon-like protein
LIPKTTDPLEASYDHLSGHEVIALRGALALALINTETLDRGKKRDALTSPEALARWWDKLCARYPAQDLIEGTRAPIVWTSDLLAAIKALRVAMRAVIIHIVEQQAVQEEDLGPINAFLELGHLALERSGHGAIKAVIRVRDSDQSSLLASIAHSALLLFTEADWRRLHQCKHDRCIVFFYDSTKSGTRCWCSPACMNRARSIQRYAATKKAANSQGHE